MMKMLFKIPVLLGLGLARTTLFLETVGIVASIGRMVGNKRHLITKAMVAVLSPYNDIQKEKEKAKTRMRQADFIHGREVGVPQIVIPVLNNGPADSFKEEIKI